MSILLLLNQKTNNTSPLVVKKPSIKESLVNASNINIDAEMGKLNEDEIVSYLEDNGHDVNAALVACLEDDKSMIDPEQQALQLTLDIHNNGKAVAGIYSHEVAEQKSVDGTTMARLNNYPLIIKVEPE